MCAERESPGMTKPQAAPAAPEVVLPAVDFQVCPIQASLGVLGKKWTLLILRDVAALGTVRFSQIQHRIDGLGARVLSKRLKELQAEGLVAKVPDAEGDPTYRLTEKGRDAWPILASFIQYGMKHKAATVFADKRPRTLAEVFPGKQRIMTGRLAGR